MLVAKPSALTHEATVAGENLAASTTDTVADPIWDNFLLGDPHGEYQQSGMWAALKRVEGWRCSRTVLRVGPKIIGGYQLLWRNFRWGRIGYVSRGPVPAGENEQLVDVLVGSLIQSARKLRLTALMVQPPASSRKIVTRLSPAHFVENRLLRVDTASLVVDISKGMEAVEAGMRRTTHQQLRKAARNGVSVREGDECDIPVFFQLMLETCRRQKTMPNPSSEKALKEIWWASGMSNRCRLTIAEHNDRPISGLFCIAFGKNVVFWKKGSSPQHLRLHAMEMLYHEAFEWAHAHGYRQCDFSALNRQIAEKLLNGVSLSDAHKASRDIFNLGFGGHAVLLPESYLHFPSPAISWAYRAFSSIPTANRYLMRMGSRLRH